VGGKEKCSHHISCSRHAFGSRALPPRPTVSRRSLGTSNKEPRTEGIKQPSPDVPYVNLLNGVPMRSSCVKLSSFKGLTASGVGQHERIWHPVSASHVRLERGSTSSRKISNRKENPVTLSSRRLACEAERRTRGKLWLSVSDPFTRPDVVKKTHDTRESTSIKSRSMSVMILCSAVKRGRQLISLASMHALQKHAFFELLSSAPPEHGMTQARSSALGFFTTRVRAHRLAELRSSLQVLSSAWKLRGLSLRTFLVMMWMMSGDSCLKDSRNAKALSRSNNVCASIANLRFGSAWRPLLVL
jgi:hypothetical protein